VPVQRFTGRAREPGPQYVRGIGEGNGNPPGDNVWLAYSVNKEDIWVSYVPVPVRAQASGWVQEDFEQMPAGSIVKGWNIYSPVWAPVSVGSEGGNQFLKLQDYDSYDYAKAVRVFPDCRMVDVAFRLKPMPIEDGRLEVELLDKEGHRLVRIQVDGAERAVKANSGDSISTVAPFTKGQWLEVSIHAEVDNKLYSLTVNGKTLVKNASFADAKLVSSLQRLEFRTGPYRLNAPLSHIKEPQMNDGLPGADEKLFPSTFYIDDVVIRGR
jgi:hypothetical protein